MKRILISIFILVWTSTAFAQGESETGFQFQMPGVKAPKGDDVNGFRIVFLYGKNRSVNGFDLGLPAFSEAADQSGFSANFGVTRVTTSSSGAAISLINIHTGKDSGLNAAFINVIQTISNGLNLGFLNLTEAYSAIDIGALSMSKKSNAQLGIINFTGEIESVQIGMLNFAENGFLPVFPLFNFPVQ